MVTCASRDRNICGECANKVIERLFSVSEKKEKGKRRSETEKEARGL